MDVNTKSKLAKVHPLLAEKVTQLITNLGADYRVVSGLRTYAEQDALYAQGRTKPGQVVTKAKGGQSNHNFGLACDVCLFTDGRADWENNTAFLKMGLAAEKLGLEWGGHWAKFIDKPHIQLPGLTVAQCRALYAKGGLDAVWAKVGGTPSKAPSTLPTVRDLKQGDRGDDVKALQTALKVTADGIFGLGTKKAVVAFQTRQDLRADGIVGKNTRERLGL